MLSSFSKYLPAQGDLEAVNKEWGKEENRWGIAVPASRAAELEKVITLSSPPLSPMGKTRFLKCVSNIDDQRSRKHKI